MKIYKITLLIIFASVSLTAVSQIPQQVWYSTYDNSYNTSFSTPTSVVTFDTLGVKMYSSTIDTSFTFQVHIFNGVQFSNEPIFTTALYQNGNDTLRAIAQLTMLGVNGDLTAIGNVNISNKTGIEIGFTYKTLASNYIYHTFMRYILMNNKFYCFTITGVESNLSLLLQYKNTFYNSIQVW